MITISFTILDDLSHSHYVLPNDDMYTSDCKWKKFPIVRHIQFNRNERQYQISLLSAPKRDRLYVSEQVETRNTEVITMMMLILLVVIIAVILHLIVHEVEHSVIPNDQKTYILMAHANNSDPLLKDLRYMPVSEERQTCNIM